MRWPALFLERLEKNAGRVIMRISAAPWFIFTDASYEPAQSGCSTCGVGGVLIDHLGRPMGCFSANLPSDLKKALGEGSAVQIILEAEMLAMIVALALWGNKIEGHPVVFYVDNNSARDIVISGCARSAIPSKLLEVFLSCNGRRVLHH